MSRFGTTIKIAALTAALFATAVVASGCLVTVEEDLDGTTTTIGIDTRPLLADLEVNWTIDHSDSASLCSIYGVDRFEVSIYGPEAREIVIDCRANWWSTENDLLALAAGDYRVTVAALDSYDFIVASTSTSIWLSSGEFEQLQINFDSAMF